MGKITFNDLLNKKKELGEDNVPAFPSEADCDECDYRTKIWAEIMDCSIDDIYEACGI